MAGPELSSGVGAVMRALACLAALASAGCIGEAVADYGDTLSAIPHAVSDRFELTIDRETSGLSGERVEVTYTRVLPAITLLGADVKVDGRRVSWVYVIRESGDYTVGVRRFD